MRIGKDLRVSEKILEFAAKHNLELRYMYYKQEPENNGWTPLYDNPCYKQGDYNKDNDLNLYCRSKHKPTEIVRYVIEQQGRCLTADDIRVLKYPKKSYKNPEKKFYVKPEMIAINYSNIQNGDIPWTSKRSGWFKKITIKDFPKNDKIDRMFVPTRDDMETWNWLCFSGLMDWKENIERKIKQIGEDWYSLMPT